MSKNSRSMAKKRLFFTIALLLVVVGENTADDTIRRYEINVCKHETAILSCGGAANEKHRWKIRININSPKKTNIPDNPRKYKFNSDSLVVKNVRKPDTRMEFYCYAVSVLHKYGITYKYSLKINCENLRASIGSLLVLQCNVNIPDHDISKVKWRLRPRKGKLTTAEFSSQVHRRGRITVGADRKLTIRDVRMGDAGRYTCIVWRIRNDLSKGTFSYKLNVAKLPTYKPRMNTTKLPTTESVTTTRAPSTKPHTMQTTTEPVTTTRAPSTKPHTMQTTTEPVTTTRAPSTKPHTMQATTGRYNSKAPRSETFASEATTNAVTASLPTKSTNLKTSDKATSAELTTEKPTTVAATASKTNTKLSAHSTAAKTKTKRPTESTSWSSTTRNPKHNVKSTIETNILDSNSDNQKLGVDRVVPTTSHNSAGTVASLVLLVGFCTSLLFFLIYKS